MGVYHDCIAKIERVFLVAAVPIVLSASMVTPAFADDRQVLATSAVSLLSNAYSIMTMIVIPIATLILALEALKILVGDEKAVEAGQKKIGRILLGTVLMFAAPLLAEAVMDWFKTGTTFNALPPDGTDAQSAFWSSIMGIYSFAVSVICAGTTVVVAASSITIIIGNQKDVEKATMQMKYAIIAMVCLLLLPAVVNATVNLLGSAGYDPARAGTYSFGVPDIFSPGSGGAGRA